MRHHSVHIAVIAAILFSAGISRAEDRPVFETETLIGYGAPLGLAISPMSDVIPTTETLTVRLGQAFRIPRWAPLGLEIDLVLPTQIDASLLLDAIRIGRFRLTVNLGISRHAGDPISVQRVERKYDITAGAQASVLIFSKVRFTLDYRAFIPDPWYVCEYYGTFARPVLNEAVKGGQVWLGIAYIW